MENISPADLHELLKNKDITLIDIREPFEFEGGHIESAINIPMGQILEKVEELKNKEAVYFVCLSDSRSTMVTREMKNRGVKAINVEGGMMVWQMNMFPTV